MTSRLIGTGMGLILGLCVVGLAEGICALGMDPFGDAADAARAAPASQRSQQVVSGTAGIAIAGEHYG